MPIRRALLLVFGFGAIPWSLAGGQGLSRTLSSAVGGELGGLGGILVALQGGCGGIFSNRSCSVRGVGTGFGLGNVLGSTLGAAAFGGSSSCGGAERFARSLAGVLGGAGVSVAGVSRTHGNLRIGLTPLVQLAESGAAAAMLSPCRPVAAAGDRAQISEPCQNPSPGLARAAAGAGLAGGYAGLYLYFHHAWWSGTPAPKWFVQNDWDQAERDADKFGHLFGGYHLTRLTSELLQAGCVGKSRAVEAAVLYAYAFQFQIEEWDGTQQLYGFSPADLIADAGGALLASVQITNGDLRYIKPVWSYRPTAAFRRRNLPGHNGQPRATTDYAGQVYWLSTDVHDALPEIAKRFWPALLRVSPGYSITDYVDPVTGQALRAKRRLLLSLDLEPEALPGNNKVWRVVKHELSFLRVPGPTLQLTPKGAYLGFYY